MKDTSKFWYKPTISREDGKGAVELDLEENLECFWTFSGNASKMSIENEDREPKN
jgi:hypothetical protein